MRRFACALGFVVLLVAAAGCGKSSSSPTQPAPLVFAVRGFVKSVITDVSQVAGATVSVIDGPNAGLSVAVAANGQYEVIVPAADSFTLKVTAPGYEPMTHFFSLTATEPVDVWTVTLWPDTPWVKRGTGSAKFTTPTYLESCTVTAHYRGAAPVPFKLTINSDSIYSMMLGPAPNTRSVTHVRESCAFVNFKIEASSDTEWEVIEKRFDSSLSVSVSQPRHAVD